MQLFGAVLLFFLLSSVAGHSYMTQPTSRSNQAQSNTGCRPEGCYGPCDAKKGLSTNTPAVKAARGSTITVKWPRNNHPGGFIRLAWAKTADSDNHAAFDAHVQQITCHETGLVAGGACAPGSASDANGGDANPGSGASGACATTIQIPLDLTDGTWTLQWSWFGGGYSLSDYYSCADYIISGGPSGAMTPVFKGGDFSNPGQPKCKFFNTNKLHVCVKEPCSEGNQDLALGLKGQQAGAVATDQLGQGGVIATPTPSPPVSTPTPAPPVSTPTPSPSPSASPSGSSSTSGKKTSSSGKTSTSGNASNGGSAPATPVGQCTHGNWKCVSSETYSICMNGGWINPLSCGTGTVCAPNGNTIICKLP